MLTGNKRRDINYLQTESTPPCNISFITGKEPEFGCCMFILFRRLVGNTKRMKNQPVSTLLVF